MLISGAFFLPFYFLYLPKLLAPVGDDVLENGMIRKTTCRGVALVIMPFIRSFALTTFPFPFAMWVLKRAGYCLLTLICLCSFTVVIYILKT